jgi:hypothetical protein
MRGRTTHRLLHPARDQAASDRRPRQRYDQAVVEPGDEQTTGRSRQRLMERHARQRARRDAAPLGSDEFRAAAEELARIEISIARLEEPAPAAPEPPAKD